MTRPNNRYSRNSYKKANTEFITFSFTNEATMEDRISVAIDAGLRNVRNFDNGVIMRYQAEVPFKMLNRVEKFLRDHPLILSVSVPTKKNLR